MKPEYIGIGNFDEDNYVYGFCQCPLSTDYAIKWPRIKDGKPHIYTCTCENCGTEVGVVSKSYGPEVGTDKTYTEELNAVRQELLDRGDEVVTFRQLVERFDEIEEAYKGVPWNLMQIYSNFNILIGKRVSDCLHGYLTSCLPQYEGEWIPVSEKLPEENKTVIASTKYGVYPETRYTKNGWEWAYEAGADYWRELEDVTAWMPLPEKPYEVNYSIKTVTNAKEAEEYQIKED